MNFSFCLGTNYSCNKVPVWIQAYLWSNSVCIEMIDEFTVLVSANGEGREKSFS
jgi:hypothetical protein